MRRFVRLLTLVTLAPVPILAAQQPASGRIVGHVVDAANGGPIPGAQVTVVGTVITAITDWSGRYALNNVPAGSYTVSVRTIGYTPKTVSDVTVPEGGAVPLDVTLVASAVEVAAVEVTAEMERGSVAQALNEQRNATGIVSAVTAEQIKKSPDSDAGQAVQRVSGVTVQDGRYVFVRGLGERYTTTSLNNARIPSPEPERKVVPLDLFPSGVLEAITTSKTFTPDQPGDFSGAQVNLRTREFDMGRVLRLAVSGSGNDAVLGRGLATAPTVGSEWLGFAGSARALPAAVRAAGDLSATSPSEMAALVGAFRNVWSAQPATGAAGSAFSASLGGEDPVLGRRVGYLGSLSYSAGQEVRQDEERAYTSSAPGSVAPVNARRGASATASVLWGGILNLNTRVGETSRLILNNTYTRSAENQATRLAGHFEEFDKDFAITQLLFTERSVASSQLHGEHLVRGKDLLDWSASVSRVTRDEPDRADLAYEAVIDPATGAARPTLWWGGSKPPTSRGFSELQESGTETGVNYRVNLGLPGRQTYVKVGAAYRSTERAADSHVYDLVNASLADSERSAPPEQVFTQTDKILLLLDGSGGRYTAADALASSYVQFDLALSERAHLVGGARLEHAKLDVLTTFASGSPAPPARLRQTDLLPSLALNLRLATSQNLRLSLSQTLSRPEYRELSPVQYRDVAGELSVQGNPDLRRALIQNFDARWEWYPSPAEVVSVAFFAKHFDDPIERIITAATGGDIISFVNADGANNVGVELELRKQLSPFTLFANTTLMRSRIQPGNGNVSNLTSARRPMVGQAGYVVNAGLGYATAGGTTATVLYNVVGRRITEAGTYPRPDTYEQPRHLVDAALRTPLVGRTAVKLDLKNLLDAAVHVTQGSVTRLRYRTGRTLSVGVSWEP